MTLPPESVLFCLAEFLKASADARGGARMLALLDEVARVPWDGRALAVHEIPQQQYADDRAAGRPDRPAFELGKPTRWQLEGYVGLLGATVLTLPEAQQLELAAGLRLTQDGWRLAWVTLVGPVWQDDEAIAHACALAECAGGPDWGAETWLERAYRRGPGRETPPLLVASKARFACHGSGSCCRNRMNIVLPASAQATVDAIPWERIAPDLVGTRLEERPDGRLTLKGPNEACRFLDENSRCRIHTALGRAVFGACAAYPFSFAETPSGVVATASRGCGSVRANLGPPLALQSDDLYERLYMAPRRVRTDTYRLRHDQEVSWETFEATEAKVLARLGGPGPLVERLIGAAELLEGPHLAPGPLDADGTLELYGLLAAITDGLATLHFPTDALRHTQLRESEVLSDILVTLVYSKKASFAHDLLTALNLGALLYFMTLAIQRGFVGRPLPVDFWELIGQVPTHSPGFLGLPDQAGDSPFVGAALRRSGYTKWLLGFAN